jgi:hypothetical protein
MASTTIKKPCGMGRTNTGGPVGGMIGEGTRPSPLAMPKKLMFGPIV